MYFAPSSLSVLIVGLLLGIRHATDPDHVIAVATIASGERSLKRASGIGALWGLGHSATIMLVGGAIIAFRLAVPQRLGMAMEMVVAVMLIFLGVRALKPAAEHVHDAIDSVARPLLVGFVHGMAGSAFIAMLVLTTVPGFWIGLGYLALFGLGTVIGMSAITAGIAVPASLASHRVRGASRYLRLASGVASIVFGLFLVHRIGFVDGLFVGL